MDTWEWQTFWVDAARLGVAALLGGASGAAAAPRAPAAAPDASIDSIRRQIRQAYESNKKAEFERAYNWMVTWDLVGKNANYDGLVCNRL